MDIGERIKSCRKIKDLTQHQLASKLGVTPQHISAIEQNNRTPSLSFLAKLGEELGVTTDYLITGKESAVNGVITSIKTDRRLKLEDKKALITLVNSLYSKS